MDAFKNLSSQIFE